MDNYIDANRCFNIQLKLKREVRCKSVTVPPLLWEPVYPAIFRHEVTGIFREDAEGETLSQETCLFERHCFNLRSMGRC